MHLRTVHPAPRPACHRWQGVCSVLHHANVSSFRTGSVGLARRKSSHGRCATAVRYRSLGGAGSTTSRAEVPHTVHEGPVQQMPALSQQDLLDFGATFVKCWFTGVAKGPAAVHQALLDTLHDDVVLVGDAVRQHNDMQGLTEVLAELERSHLEYPHSQHQPILYAASPEKQHVYALVEGRYQDAGGLPGHPATFRVSRVHVVFALEVVSRKVSKLWLRRQLTEEDKEELVHDPVHCYPHPFPKDHLKLANAVERSQAAAAMVDGVKQWWHTWSRPARQAPTSTGAANAITNTRDSSHASNSAAGGATAGVSSVTGVPAGAGAPAPSSSAQAATEGVVGVTGAPAASSSYSPAVAPSRGSSSRSFRRPRESIDTTAAAELLADDFRLLDAYGLYSRMRGKGRRFLNKEGTLRFLQQLAYQYHIDLQVQDVSVAEGSLCCFTQWRAVLTPKFGVDVPGAQPTTTTTPAAAAPADQTAGGSRWSTTTGSVTAGMPAGVAAAAAAVQAAEAFMKRQPATAQQAADASPAAPASAAAGSGSPPGAPGSGETAAAGGSDIMASAAPSPAVAAALDSPGFVLEGMEVDVFDAHLKLHDIWLFRGPLDSEHDLFLLTDQQAAEQQRELEAAQQERLLQMRREHREQQLQELLTWMTTYQQQWAQSIAHVQQVLQHHQRNLQETAAAIADPSSRQAAPAEDPAAGQRAGPDTPPTKE